MSDKISGMNPWTHIWTHPRETIRNIVRFNPKYRFIILSFLYGLPMLFYWAQTFSLGQSTSAMGIVIGAVVLATFAGMLTMTIMSGLILWTGKWIGGKSTYYPIRATLAWSSIPNIFEIIIWAILIYFFREGLFLNDFPQEGLSSGLLFFTFGLLMIQFALIIWSLIILVKGLGEVQKFSAWKALLNVVIAGAILGIFVFIGVFLIYMITMMIAG